MVDDLVVVIRSSGERTKDACMELVREEVPQDRIVVIEEKPFNQAVKKSFEIGLDFGLAWTLCVDADLFILRGTIQRIVQEAESYSTQIFGITGYVWDKFYGSRKKGGPHIYRTQLLAKALSHVPEADETLRPETYVKQVMASQGFSWPECKTVFALHDYEQFYSDIFRKMVVRANKSEQAVKSLLKYAYPLREIDPDFLVASWGINYGKAIGSKKLLIHSEQWRDQAEILMFSHGLEEKKDVSIEWIHRVVNAIAHDSKITPNSIKGKRIPTISRFIGSAGRLLSRLGAFLQYRAIDFQ